jgi:hypothetical protein
VTSTYRRATLVHCLAALSSAVPVVLTAQVSMTASTGALRAPGLPSTGTMTLSPEISARALGLSLQSVGQLTFGGIGRTRTAFESLLSARRAAPLGLAPIVSLRAQDDPLGTSEQNRRFDGAFGVRVGSGQFGGAATVGVAQSVHAGSQRGIQTASASVHVARRGVQLRVAYVGNAFDATGQMPAALATAAIARTRLSDVTSEGSWTYRRFEVGGFVGRRVGGHGEHDATWGGAHASLMLTDRLGLVARQQTTPADPTRHLAAQRMTTLGFRYRPTLARARFDDGSDAGRFRKEFVLTRIDSLTHAIRVYHPDAVDVEIAGSFNEWSPAPMRRAGRGWWEVQIPVGTGMHFLNVRSDGGRWTVPPGLQTAADEFNGTVGVLLIP